MKSSFIQAAVLSFFGLIQANFLELRNTCKNDNCLNEVRCQDPHQASIAKTDCSSFLQSTVTSTFTPATVTKTVIVSVVCKTTTQTVTATAVKSSTVTVSTETDTFIAISTTTATVLIDIPITSILTILARRNYNSIPTYASCCSSSAMYSSACSCAGVIMHVTSTTVTAPIPTKTFTLTSTVTSTITIVKTTSTTATISKTATTSTTTSTTTTATTDLIGTTTFVIFTTTSTTTPAAAMSTAPFTLASCPEYATGDFPASPFYFDQYFAGVKVIENPVNPGVDVTKPALTFQFPGSMSPCSAYMECADKAVNFDNDYQAYASLDLHYRISIGMWECVLYGNPNTNPNYFNVVDLDIREAYGFSAIFGSYA